MSKKTKKILIIASVILGVIVVAFFIIQYVANRKFENFVTQLPERYQLQYDDYDINLLSGSLSLEKPLLTLKGQTTDDVIAQISMNDLNVANLGYWDFLLNDEISIETIILNNLKTIYYHNKLVEADAYGDKSKTNLKQSISIENFKITQADIDIIDVATDSTMFRTENLNLKVSQINFNSETSTAKIPFKIEELSLASENMFYMMGDYEHLSIQSIQTDKSSSLFSNLKMKTKYSKTELSKRIKKERDYFDLDIASVEIKGQDIGFFQDSIFSFKGETMVFENPKAEIYRDKLIADDYVVKSLYSKMLRELSFNLTLNEVVLKNALIVYEEKVKSENKAGQLKFTDLNATIKNLSNTYSEPEKTTIAITTKFMEQSPLSVDWSFDVNDVNDTFLFKADLGMLKAEYLNQFMKPNLNVELEGELLKTYFTIGGNANTSNIDLKTNYDQFDVSILQENGKEKNKFLSSVINLFVSKSSKNNSDGYRYGSPKDVERDKTKSVFNYIWLNAKAALLSAMTGSGEKEE